MYVVILYFLRKRLQAEPPHSIADGSLGFLCVFFVFFVFFSPNETQQCRVTHNVFILVGTSHIFGTLF